MCDSFRLFLPPPTHFLPLNNAKTYPFGDNDEEVLPHPPPAYTFLSHVSAIGIKRDLNPNTKSVISGRYSNAFPCSSGTVTIPWGILRIKLCCTHTNTHTHINTRTQTQTHTYTCAQRQKNFAKKYLLLLVILHFKYMNIRARFLMDISGDWTLSKYIQNMLHLFQSPYWI